MSVDALVDLLSTLGPAFTPESTRQALSNVEVDDGKVRYQDFLEWVFGEKLELIDQMRDAILEGNVPLVQSLLPKLDLNALNAKGRPVLWTPCDPKEEIISLLLDARADIQGTDEYGNTPMLWACNFNHTRMMAALLKANADPNSFAPVGAAPLHYACRNGGDGCLALLLAAKADTNVRSSCKDWPLPTVSGWTPLHVASAYGLHLNVTALLSRGADSLAKDGADRRPVDVAMRMRTKALLEGAVVDVESELASLPPSEIRLLNDSVFQDQVVATFAPSVPPENAVATALPLLGKDLAAQVQIFENNGTFNGTQSEVFTELGHYFNYVSGASLGSAIVDGVAFIRWLLAECVVEARQGTHVNKDVEAWVMKMQEQIPECDT